MARLWFNRMCHAAPAPSPVPLPLSDVAGYVHLVPFADGSVSVTGERIVATSVLLPQPAISFFREVAPQVGGGAVHWVCSSEAPLRRRGWDTGFMRPG